MKHRIIFVTGQEPATSDQVNRLLISLDLGLLGAFIPFQHSVTAVFSEDMTLEQLKRQIIAVKQTYESLGCVNVDAVGGQVIYDSPD